MDTTSKIYEIIKQDNSANTFYNNQKLFKEFYYHDIYLIYHDTKMMDIFKYV